MIFDDNEYTDTFASKTQHKRDATDLQQLGDQLMALSHDNLARLPLTSELLRGLEEAKRITSKEARRRHAQFIGKLIRRAEHVDIEQALESLMDPTRQQRLAQWISQLDQALADQQPYHSLLQQLLEWFPHTDRQHLRNLIRNLPKLPTKEDDEASNKLQQTHRLARQKLHRYLIELDRQAPLF